MPCLLGVPCIGRLRRHKFLPWYHAHDQLSWAELMGVQVPVSQSGTKPGWSPEGFLTSNGHNFNRQEKSITELGQMTCERLAVESKP